MSDLRSIATIYRGDSLSSALTVGFSFSTFSLEQICVAIFLQLISGSDASRPKLYIELCASGLQPFDFPGGFAAGVTRSHPEHGS